MSLTLTDQLTAAAHAVLEPLDVEQYYRLMETGVIREGAPIELIDGLMVRKDRRDRQGDIMTIGTRHSTVIQLLGRILNRIAAEPEAHVRIQQPLTINRRNVPEPDVCMVEGRVETYSEHHPAPDETLLVIEVADSSLEFDLGRKQELYRDARIAEYWVVNLQADVIEVFREPADGQWREVRRYARGQSIETLLCGQTVSIAVDAVLPPVA